MPAVQLVILTVLLVVALGFWVQSHSSLPGKHWYLLSNVAMVWWLVAVGLELSAQSVGCAIRIAQGAWIGIVLLPTFWAFFLYEYALGVKVPRLIVRCGVFCAPALILFAALTSGWHHAFYGPNTQFVTDGGAPYVYYDHGPLFFVAVGYLYLVLMAAIVITGRAVLTSTPAVRSFFLKLFAGTSIPVAVNLSYLIGDFYFLGSDPTSFSFAFSLILVAWLIADNRWIDVNAIARELLFYNSTDPVFVLNRLGKVIETNPAAADLLTQDDASARTQLEDGALGQLITHLVHHNTLPDVTDIQWGMRHFAVRAHVISLGEGQKKLGWAVALLDVTTQKIAAQKAIAAEQMQSQFLATVSHELRTPLTVINGSLGLLASGNPNLTDTQRDHLMDRAICNTASLTKLVNDLIDTQSLRNAAFSMQFVECDLIAIVSTATENAESLQPEKNITFTCTVDEKPLMVRADSDRLGQVLGNVLSNAVKFSKPGDAVAVTAGRADGNAVITVTDPGCGIPPNSETKVFAPFSQLDASDTKTAYGSGLGLHISRQIMDRHGGSIRYVSAPGVGTTFTIALPLAA
nr:histidine kinase N-terminal 7TM domain-containing protein [Sulfitobacter maritimus]